MKSIYLSLTFLSILFFSLSCKEQFEVTPDGVKIDRSGLKDWTNETHSNEVEPNYAVVFNNNQLNTLEITLTKAQWDSIRADMVKKVGYDFGKRATGGIGGGGPQQGGGMPAGGQAGGGVGKFYNGEPMYVESSVKFNGKEWYKVGFRLKGNSSLSTAWGSGIYKVPFKLQFDEFEDKYPEIYNQRFYGFKEFAMNPAHGDNSIIKDKLTSDIFREAGVPTNRGVFVRVSINFGDGLKYCGVYTLFEVPEDTMVKSQFGEDKGNIYKPESNFATFNQANFEKKNNKTLADYSDVQSFVTALNASNRTTDAVTWRANLEKVFNVDHFIKYLAINNTIVNWDGYGAIAHNYYMYNHSTKKLMWIPWDFNYSMTTGGVGGGAVQGGGQQGGGMQGQGGMGGFPPINIDSLIKANGGQLPGGGMQGGAMGGVGGGMQGVSLAMTEVGTNWPLIKYIAADPTYYAKYKTYIKDFNDKYFQSGRMNAIIDKEVSLISSAVMQEAAPYSYLTNTSVFSTAITDLKTHISNRNKAVTDFLK